MYNNHIIITAYNSDTEGWRSGRLHRVVGFIFALAGSNGDALLNKIKELNDDKGTLEVTWSAHPTSSEAELLSKAWMSGIGDGADQVEHKIDN